MLSLLLVVVTGVDAFLPAPYDTPAELMTVTLFYIRLISASNDPMKDVIIPQCL